MDLADQHMWWKQTGGQELRRLLIDIWDPIGVKGHPEAADEYDSYRSGIVGLVRNGASAGELAEHLAFAEERMGLSTAPESLRLVAEQLLVWYPASIARWRQGPT